MRSYVYESVKLSNGKRMVTRYTIGETLFLSISKFLFYLFVVWPLQLFVWLPIKIIFKITLIILEMILRAILWVIKLPFCLLFLKKKPQF